MSNVAWDLLSAFLPLPLLCLLGVPNAITLSKPNIYNVFHRSNRSYSCNSAFNSSRQSATCVICGAAVNDTAEILGDSAVITL